MTNWHYFQSKIIQAYVLLGKGYIEEVDRLIDGLKNLYSKSEMKKLIMSEEILLNAIFYSYTDQPKCFKLKEKIDAIIEQTESLESINQMILKNNQVAAFVALRCYNSASALKYANNAYDLCKDKDASIFDIAYSEYLIGQSMKDRGNIHIAVSFSKTSVENFRQLEVNSLLLAALVLEASCLRRLGDIDESIVLLTEA
ncbi:MAG: hypothetical protein ACXAC7_08085, partial [Candidatus Hodarchaeales archaeon]